MRLAGCIDDEDEEDDDEDIEVPAESGVGDPEIADACTAAAEDCAIVVVMAFSSALLVFLFASLFFLFFLFFPMPYQRSMTVLTHNMCSKYDSCA
jgi:hypothetical protein